MLDLQAVDGNAGVMLHLLFCLGFGLIRAFLKKEKRGGKALCATAVIFVPTISISLLLENAKAAQCATNRSKDMVEIVAWEKHGSVWLVKMQFINTILPVSS